MSAGRIEELRRLAREGLRSGPGPRLFDTDTIVLELCDEVDRLMEDGADLRAKAADLKAIALNCERRAVAAETEAENFQRLLADCQGRA